MWQLVKSELKYYRVAFSAFIFFTILFHLFEFFVMKTMLQMDGEIAVPQINTWGFNFSLLLGFSIFQVWQNRIKEKRERHLLLLPLSKKQISACRFWFTVIPFIIIVFYFFSVNLMANIIFQVKLTTPAMAFGLIFVFISATIFIRDAWFSYWDLGERVGVVFLHAIIVLAPLFYFLYTLQINQGSRISTWDLPYSNIQFFILGLAIMGATIFSYQKRKNYLS